MKRLAAHAAEGVFILDDRGTILDCSAEAARLFGFPAEELRGSHLSRLIERTHRRGFARELECHLHRKSGPDTEIKHELPGERKDGSVFPMQISVCDLRPRPGSCFLGIVQDLATCQETERRLQQREEELLQVVRHAPTAIATMSPEGRYLSVNRSLCSMLGYSEADLVGKSFLDVTHPRDVEKSADYLGRLTRGTIEDYRLSKRYLHRDGRVVDAVLHCSLVHDDEKRPFLIIAQIEDRTERLRAEAEARQHREQLARVTRLSTLGELATGLAHEINQPLSAIGTYARACSRMIENGPGDRAEVLEALAKIAAQAQRAGEVIQRLRDLIRGQEGERVRLSVNDLVREALKLVETAAREDRLKVVTDFAAGLPPIQADRVQIQQVLLNLLRNAMESMRDVGQPGEAVTVGTASDGNEVEIWVRDRGRGISEAIEDRLFRPFFTTKSSGLGMGLSISRTIARSHGGRLDFTRNPDRGTTFRLTLPACGEPHG